MPLWHVFHPPSTFDNYATKRALAKAITSIYTDRGLPAFYVNVYFHAVPGEDTWIGGVAQAAAPDSGDPFLSRPFVRLVGENIAVNMGDDTARKDAFSDRVTKYLTPLLQGKGYDWEFHVDETSKNMWRVQGLRAPEVGSEPFKLWVQENKAVPWEDTQAGNVPTA
ncbi:hypothetical protein GQ53DRAFT_843007 [Thozetella sp. PMI_491]|nr:hypothetical protein GQ53DRAFT_843007 [Thozetella sp. PMI_491]